MIVDTVRKDEYYQHATYPTGFVYFNSADHPFSEQLIYCSRNDRLRGHGGDQELEYGG